MINGPDFDPSSKIHDIRDKLEERARRDGRQSPPLKSGGGDGTSGGMTDDWKASVDRQLEALHGDVRELRNWGIGAIALILGALATAYIKVSDQVTSVQVAQATANEKLSNVDQRLGKVEQKLDDVDGKVSTIDRKLDRISDKLGVRGEK